jgi:hypothetical protein
MKTFFGKFFIHLMILSSLSGQSFAQTFSNDGRDGFRAITAALLAFSTDDSLSGGTFSIESETPDLADADLLVLKTYVEIPLTDPKADIVPLLEVSPSYQEIEQKSIDGRDSVEVDSVGLGAGLGVRMGFLEDFLQVTPRFKLQYSRLDYEITAAGVDQATLDSLSPSLNTWIYQPSLEVMLKPKLNERGGLVLLKTNYSFLFSNATTSNSRLGDFSEKSSIWKNTIAIEQPITFIHNSPPVVFRPGFALVEIFGDAKDGFDLNNFYEIGLDIFSLSIGEPLFSELGIGFRYIFEDEITGWRFGFFGDLS